MGNEIVEKRSCSVNFWDAESTVIYTADQMMGIENRIVTLRNAAKLLTEELGIISGPEVRIYR